MGEEVKKISFGFSKFTKKTQIVSSTLNQVKKEQNSVELIDCFEGKSIKLKNPVQPVDKLLVIPLQRHQENTVDIDNNSKTLTSDVSDVDDRGNRFITANSDKVDNVLPMAESSENSVDLTKDTKILSLDEIAAREILEDLNDKKNKDVSRIFTVPLTNNPPAGEKESSLEDYENIPVGDFGLAMLRGMGWAPGKGIGKNEKLVTPSLPTLRPKGMGLGADTVLKASVDIKTTTNEDLRMVKNSFIRVIAGQHKDSYGQIEGFDDETGRLIVKLVLKNMSVSLNEFMVQLVDKVEFLKNSKVINVSKYERYKDGESKKKHGDENIHRKSVGQQSPVHKLNQQHRPRPSHSTGKSKIEKFDSDSPEMEIIGRETERKRVEPSRKSHKHKRRSRSRSSSTSSTNVKPSKISKERSSKRSRSRSSSFSSAGSYRRRKKSSKSKHKHRNSDRKSSQREKPVQKKKSRSTSSSSNSSVASECDKISERRTKLKTSSTKTYQSNRRSPSPRERNSSKKYASKYR